MDARRTRSGVLSVTPAPARSKRSLASGKDPNLRRNSVQSEVSGTTIEVQAEIHVEDNKVEKLSEKETNDGENKNFEEKPPDNIVDNVEQSSELMEYQENIVDQIQKDGTVESKEKELVDSEMTEVEVMVPAIHEVEMKDEHHVLEGTAEPQPDATETMNTDASADVNDDQTKEQVSSVLEASQEDDQTQEDTQASAAPGSTIQKGLSEADSCNDEISSKSEERFRYGKVQALKKQDIYELCHQCGKGFLNIVDLQSHMKAEHNNVVQYHCLLCHMVYLQREKAIKHSEIEHKDTDGIYIYESNELPTYRKSTETFISARPKKRGASNMVEEFFPYTLEKNEVPVKVEMENHPKRRRPNPSEKEANANNNHKSLFGTSLIPSHEQSPNTKPYRFVGKTYESRKKAGQTLVISPAHVMQDKKMSTKVYTDNIRKAGLVHPIPARKDEEAEETPDNTIADKQLMADNALEESGDSIKSEQQIKDHVQNSEHVQNIKEEEKENTSLNTSTSGNTAAPDVEKVDRENNVYDIDELEPGEELFHVAVLSDSEGEDKVPGFSSRNKKHVIWKYALRSTCSRGGKKPEIKCRLCHTICPSKDSFFSHIALNHRSLVPWKCDYCDYQSRWLTSFRVHLRRKHPEKNFEKCECGKQFYTVQELKEHHKEHLTVTCTTCKKTFPNEATFQLHYKTSHTHAKVKYSCPACHKTYSSKMECMTHIQENHLSTSAKQGKSPAPASFSCPVCGEKTANQQGLSEHMKVHGLLRYCGTCKKNFSTDDAFRLHMQSHNKEAEGQFKCSTCGKEHSTVEQLSIHFERTHKQKVFTCVKCQKKFKSKEDFQSHIATNHQEDVMFRCSLCPNILFRALSTAQQHYQEKHGKNKLRASVPTTANNPGENAPTGPTRTLYRCAECQQCYQTAEACIQHQRIHTENLSQTSAMTPGQGLPSSTNVAVSIQQSVRPGVSLLSQSLIASQSSDSPLRQALMAPKATAATLPSSVSVSFLGSKRPIVSKGSNSANLVQIFMCERCNSYFPNANSLAMHVVQTHSDIQSSAPAKAKPQPRLPAIISRPAASQPQQPQQQGTVAAPQQFFMDDQGNLVPLQVPNNSNYVLLDGQQNMVLQGDAGTDYSQVMVTNSNTADQNQTWVVNQQDLGQYLLPDNKGAAGQPQAVEWVVESIEEPNTSSTEYYAPEGTGESSEYYTSIPSSGAEYYSTAPSGTEYYTEAPSTGIEEYCSVENPQGSAVPIDQGQYGSMKQESTPDVGLVKLEEQSFVTPKTEEGSEELGLKIGNVVSQSDQSFQMGETEQQGAAQTSQVALEVHSEAPGNMEEQYGAGSGNTTEAIVEGSDSMMVTQEQYATTQSDNMIAKQEQYGATAPAGIEGAVNQVIGEQEHMKMMLQKALSAQGLQDLVQVNVTPKAVVAGQEASTAAGTQQLSHIHSSQAAASSEVISTEENMQQLTSIQDENAAGASSSQVVSTENLSLELSSLPLPGNKQCSGQADGYNTLQESMLTATGEQLLGDLQQQQASQQAEPDSAQQQQGDFLHTSASLDVSADFQTAQDVMAQFQQQAAEIQQEFEQQQQQHTDSQTVEEGGEPAKGDDVTSQGENMKGEVHETMGAGFATESQLKMEGMMGEISKEPQEREETDQGFEQGGQLEQSTDQGGQVEQSTDQGGQVEQGFEQGAQVEQGFEQGAQVEQGFEQGAQVEQGFEQRSQVEQSFEQEGQLEQSTDQGGQVEQGFEQGGQVEQGFEQGGQVEQGFEQRGHVEQGFEQGGQIEQGFEQGGQLEQGFEQGGQLEGIEQATKIEPGVEQGEFYGEAEHWPADGGQQEVAFQPSEQAIQDAQYEAPSGTEEQVVLQVEVPEGHTLVQFDGNIDPAILQHAVSQINGPNGELYLVVPENILYTGTEK